jgi:hypothetical protein
MTNETWSEVALVSLSKLSGTNVEFYSITNSIELTVGDKDVNFMPMLNGGRLADFKPQGDIEGTMEVYAVEAGTDSGSTAKGVFDLLGTTDATQPVSFSNSRTRDKYRVTVLFTDDTTVTSAVSDINLNQTGLRFIIKGAYITSVTPSGAMTPNDPLKFQVKFKAGAFDKDGTSNLEVQSTDGTATMTMTSAYA